MFAVRHARWTISAGLAAGALLMAGIGAQLVGLPLIKQADIVEAWFAGRAEFGLEQAPSGVKPFRAARWDTLKPGNCSIKDAEVTITREGNVKFSAKVKSKDDGDLYCIILHVFDHEQTKLWSSPKLCTPFELHDEFAGWIISAPSFRSSDYRFVAYATREDYC